MVPRKPSSDPPTDEEWDRRSLEGDEPDEAKVRSGLRRLEEHTEALVKLATVVAPKSDTLVAMAENRERVAVLRTFIRRFAFATAALLAAMTLFREQVMSWLSFLRGSP